MLDRNTLANSNKGSGFLKIGEGLERGEAEGVGDKAVGEAATEGGGEAGGLDEGGVGASDGEVGG